MSRIISVFGLVPGAGTTFVSTNIAAFLAKEEANTLLIGLGARGVLGALFMVESAREQVHPTIETWRDFENHGEFLLRTSYGLAILPGCISVEERQEISGTCVNEILEYFAPMFDVVVIDVGGDLYLPHFRPSVAAADVNFIVAEPTQRCIQALPDHQKGELIRNRNVQLVVNKVGSYYHPRDIARWLGIDKYIAVPDEPARLNEAIKKRIPLVLCGKGKACAKLKTAAIEALNVELKDKDDQNDNTSDYTLKHGNVSFTLEDLFKEQPKQRAENDSVVNNEICEEEVTHTKLPDGFVVFGGMPGAKCFTDVKDVCAVRPSAVLVPSTRPDLLDVIKSLRRYNISAIPVVVVGRCNISECYAAGADECVEILNDMTIERIKARAARMNELWSKTVKDDLTGLYKRDFLNNYLVEQENRYRETGVTFSIIMTDLDHFKKVNDTYGHQAGDLVLKEFAQFLLSSVRQTDIVARYGGEEFVMVFPGVHYNKTVDITNKIRRAWEVNPIKLPDGRKIKCTFSAGVAGYGEHAEGIETIIKACDTALYNAKHSGRNRIVVYDDSQSITSEPETQCKKALLPISINSLFRKKPVKNIIIVISGEGGGKTTISVNLAVTIALQGKTVAFIDGDLESLAAHHLIGGVPSGRALFYALKSPSEATGYLETVPLVPQLYSLTADPIEAIELKLFSKLPDVIRKIGSEVDTVVVDTPPDPRRVKYLAKIADRTVLVITPDITLDDYAGIKIPNSVLLLNCWPPELDVSFGENLCGVRASGVIPILNEVLEAERGGLPAVLGCSRLHQTMSSLVTCLAGSLKTMIVEVN